MINFLLNFAVPRYYFTSLKPGDSFGGDGTLYGHVEEQSDETSQRRFFGTCVPQNDRKITLRMTFNETFVRTKVTKSRRDKRFS